MKNLANCKPSEFLVQTNRIRKSVEKWLTVTEIHEIRKRVPKYDEDMSPEERTKVKGEQIRRNMADILDAVLEKHPEETIEVMALACFIEPEDADNHPMTEYLDAIRELISNESVLSFFTSLASLGNSGILTLVE